MSKRKQKRKQGRSVEGRLRFLGGHVDGFRSWLRRNGYRPTTIVEVVRLLALGPNGWQRPDLVWTT